MKNNLYIYSEKDCFINIERFHICTWEFLDEQAMIEIGVEILNTKGLNNEINLKIYLPWFNDSIEVCDLFTTLVDPENSKLIFNEPAPDKKYVHKEKRELGIILEFSENKKLCLMPLSDYKIDNQILNISLDAQTFLEKYKDKNINIYFRFYIKTKAKNLTIRRNGMNKTSIIYDFQINERRNLPKQVDFNSYFCRINQCYFLNIIPNSHEVSFYDNNSLKNIRTLEYKSFKNYINDNHIEEDNLIVVFNKNKILKKQTQYDEILSRLKDISAEQKPIPSKNKVRNVKQLPRKDKENTFYFFIKYQKENVGSGQVFLAILINFLCQLTIGIFACVTNSTSKYYYYSLIVLFVIMFILTISVIFSNKWKAFKLKRKVRKME